MKDQELFTYFKSKSNSFEEMPSSDLWNKIEQNLQQNSTPSINLKNILLKLILPIITILIIVVMVNKKEKNFLKKEILIKNDTVKKKKTIMIYDSIGNNKKQGINVISFKKEIIPFKEIINSNTEKLPIVSLDSSKIINNKNHLKLAKGFIKHNKINTNFNISKDTSSVKYEVIPISGNNSIIYKTKIALSKEKYKVFTNDLKELYKDSTGKQIIVKATGFNTSRFTIEPLEIKNILLDSLSKHNLPKPTADNIVNYFKVMNRHGATFFIDDKKISFNEALKIIRKDKTLEIKSTFNPETVNIISK